MVGILSTEAKVGFAGYSCSFGRGFSSILLEGDALNFFNPLTCSVIPLIGLLPLLLQIYF